MKLQGEKVVLRDWVKADLEKDKYWHTGEHLWMTFNGPYYPLPALDIQEKWRAERLLKIEKDDWGEPRLNLIIADSDSNEMIGTVNRYWQSIETHWLSVGIVIYDENKWSGGIGYDALYLWCDYLFREMPEIARLDMRTWSGNNGMMRLAEKLGFTKEAIFRKARIVKGDYYDSIGYGILREEFEKRFG